MREIEIKARLRDPVSIVKSLQNLGIELTKAIKQHDRVFAQKGNLGNELDSIWLRIRTENDHKHIITLKRSVTGQLDSIEYETQVENATELEKIILEMDYEPYSDLTKIRRKGKLHKVEICIDEVPGLGTFIEAEKMMEHSADHNQVTTELWQLFDKLGINKKDEVLDGYDVLERKQRGL